jgi:hypothetical protein
VQFDLLPGKGGTAFGAAVLGGADCRALLSSAFSQALQRGNANKKSAQPGAFF